jgi:hypothetical protein
MNFESVCVANVFMADLSLKTQSLDAPRRRLTVEKARAGHLGW